jgi:uncharacterized protein
MIAFPAAMLILAGLVFASLVAAPTSMTVVANPPAIASPCNKICTVEPVSALCIGCGRSLTEIANWIGLSDDDRSRIMAELPRRLASLRPSDAKPAKQA